jgi:hypothetical protein
MTWATQNEIAVIMRDVHGHKQRYDLINLLTKYKGQEAQTAGQI